MQIEAIKVSDYIKTEESNSVGYGVGMSGAKSAESSKGKDELKALSVESAFYNKEGNLAENGDFKKDIAQAEELGLNTVKQVDNVKNAWGDKESKEMQEDGFDPMDTDVATLVTVVDEIKMNMAKAGADISKMGGLSDAEIEAMSGSMAQAMEMGRGLNNQLTDEEKVYLVKNELEPTITNIYNATYSAPENSSKTMSDKELIELLEQLGDKLDKIIEEVDTTKATVDNTIDAKEVCGKMLASDVPVTKENLEYMLELESYEKPSEDEVIEAIDDIVREGKDPVEAYLIEGYSLMDQAREKVETINSVEFESLFEDITARRQLEEVRLTMTVEATFTMMKNGINVDTTDLQQLIDNLRRQETSLLRMLMKTDSDEKTDRNINIFQETMDNLADIVSAPPMWLGRFSNVESATFTEIHQVSVSITAEYSRMEATYEAVGTEVRRDLGDSMSKAFSNVDDILDDLDLEINESNEKAVRILAYNQIEITSESVGTMKNADEMVSRVFKNMTPQVVSEMIKRGDNPLDMKMSELLDKTEEIKAEVGSESDTESFAKFLWKVEHTEGISEDERDSYVGIYRLLNQVEKTDGAAIGALIQQGTEVTLRNLMMAVRSEKHSGREYEVSDTSGVIDELVMKDLSITEQVEKAFLTNRCKDAKEAMTPAKMQAVGEDSYMNMNPDEFAQAMEEITDEISDDLYAKNITEQLKSAMDVDKDVYRLIEEFNIPNTPNMISALNALIENNNEAIKYLYEKYSKQEDMDIEYLIQEAYERFAESCKTPEEMAEAEEALGVLAENVMRTMINTEDVDTIDLNGMKLVLQQCKAMGSMATSSETYHIPLMVADEAGNMNLRIVRGTGESGLIKMALYLESTGTISSTFRYENGQVDANITCETAQMREAFAADAPIIAQTMQEETGFSFSFSFVRDVHANVNEIYNNEIGNFEVSDSKDNEIQTKALYGIARGFIKVVGEMFS